MQMFASMPHAFDFDPKIVVTCVEILGLFFDRIFRSEQFVFALDPAIRGDWYIDMEGNAHETVPAMGPPPPAAGQGSKL